MTIKREQGWCAAFTRDGGVYHLARSEYARLLAEWQRGAAFFTGLGTYGQPVAVKLAEVQGVSELTPGVLRRMDENDREEEREKMITGEG